jgi:O-antigen/teichoic acid export membrane protein
MLAGLIDAQTMGLYTIAFMLANSVQMVMSMVAGNVVYPALSEVARERPNELAATANKFQRLGDMFLVTTCGFLILGGSAIVGLLYDSRYQDAGPMLSLLAIGTIGMRYQVIEQCYFAMGKPQISTIGNLLRLVVLFVGLPIAFHYFQFFGALAIIVACQYAGWPAAIYFKLRYRLMDWRVELMALPALAVGLLLGYVFQAAVPSHQAFRALFLHS